MKPTDFALRVAGFSVALHCALRAAGPGSGMLPAQTDPKPAPILTSPAPPSRRAARLHPQVRKDRILAAARKESRRAAPTGLQFRLDGSDYDVEIALLALEGILNRDAPRLYLDTSAINWPGPEADALWQQWYVAMCKGLHFQPISDLSALLRRTRDRLRGLALYDPEVDATRYLALTRAHDGLLPISRRLLRDPRFAPVADLPVLEDFTNRFSSDLEAYTWAVRELLPKCNRQAVYNAGRSHGSVYMGSDRSVQLALDYAVQQGMFIMNLPFSPKPFRPPAGKNAGVDYSELCRLVDCVLDSLQKPAAVWGWAEPERAFARRVSAHDDFVVCGAAPNLSFHRHVPVGRFRRRPPSHTVPPLEPRVYVTFLSNEGDTPKALVSEYRVAWQRWDGGKTVPITWLVNPWLLSRFPALAEFYYSRCRRSHAFGAACSGAGYAILSSLPHLDLFASHTRRYMDQWGLRTIDVWTDRFDPDAWTKYARSAGAEALSIEGPIPVPAVWAGDGTPFTATPPDLIYWMHHVPKGTPAALWLARKVRTLAEKQGRPAFIQVYSGASGPLLHHVMTLLGEEFRAVPYDVYAALIRRYGELSTCDGPVYCVPGRPCSVSATVRNFTGTARERTVRLEAPEGWHVPEPVRRVHVPPHGSRRLTWRVIPPASVSGKTSRVYVKAADTCPRSVPLRFVRAIRELSLAPDAWAPWPGGAADARRVPDGLEVRNAPGRKFSAVEIPFEADFGPDLHLLLDVRLIQGAWAAKVRGAATMRDRVLVGDRSRGGHCVVPLDAPQWHGRKKARLVLFSISDGGCLIVRRAALIRMQPDASAETDRARRIEEVRATLGELQVWASHGPHFPLSFCCPGYSDPKKGRYARPNLAGLAGLMNRLFQCPRLRDWKLRFDLIDQMPSVGTPDDLEEGGFAAEVFFQSNIRVRPGRRTLCYMDVRKMSLFRFFRYVCLMTGMHWGIGEHGVVMADRDVPLPAGVVPQGPAEFRLKKSRNESKLIMRNGYELFLPKPDLDNCDGIKALQFLAERSCQLDPDGLGFSLIFLVDPDRVRPVTFHARDVPLRKAFAEVCRQAGVEFRVERGTILIIPPSR